MYAAEVSYDGARPASKPNVTLTCVASGTRRITPLALEEGARNVAEAEGEERVDG